MRAQTYRPRVQNGSVAKRRSRAAAPKVSERGAKVRRSSRGARHRSRGRNRQQGSNVLWVLIFTGAMVAAGFIIALRSQINALQLGQAEAQLRAELDEIANRQRFEILERQRALSTGESDRVARQAGLVQPRFDQLQRAQQAQRAIQPAVSRNQPERSSKGKKENYEQRQSARNFKSNILNLKSD